MSVLLIPTLKNVLGGAEVYKIVVNSANKDLTTKTEGSIKSLFKMKPPVTILCSWGKKHNEVEK